VVIDDDNLKITAIILTGQRLYRALDGGRFVASGHNGNHGRPGLQFVMRMAILVKCLKQPESTPKKNKDNPDYERKGGEKYGKRGHAILCRENEFRG
jgi:hypothetical protein